jgi:ATP-dependent DNA ligase
MKNYAEQWKKDIGLRQISYNDFVSLGASGGYYIQKVDGMLGVLIYNEGSYPFFQTTRAREIIDIPAISEYETLFKKNGIKSAKIPGELVAKVAGKILPFNKTQSVVKRFAEPQNKDLIYHYPLDVIELNNKKYSFKESLRFFDSTLGKYGLPHVTRPKMVIGGLEEFRKLYEETLKTEGFDGVIGRSVDGKNYKIKFVSSVDLVVIGAGHEDMKAWSKGEVSYLLTSFIDKDGKFRSSSKIGTGFKRSRRQAFYKFIKNETIYTEKGEYFIKPKLVIEVNYFRNRITPTPTYDFKNGKYNLIGNNQSVTFSHPGFLRIRSDKSANKYDTRLEQIPEWSY